jgi:hypothetical protein
VQSLRVPISSSEVMSRFYPNSSTGARRPPKCRRDRGNQARKFVVPRSRPV